MIDWAWALDHLDDLAGRAVQHTILTAIAVGFGFSLSLVLSVWAVRRRGMRGPLVTGSSVIYTIPSLALFAALVPLTGLSLVTAVLPLTLYTLVIFVRNILAGFDGIPAEVLETADAMGYTGRSRLIRVELPLALPLVMGGIRLATVSTIGLVTVSGILGDRFGGLGFFIFEGYRHVFPTEILFGALPSIMLAIVADVALVGLERRLTPWTRTPGAGSDGAAPPSSAGLPGAPATGRASPAA